MQNLVYISLVDSFHPKFNLRKVFKDNLFINVSVSQMNIFFKQVSSKVYINCGTSRKNPKKFNFYSHLMKKAIPMIYLTRLMKL